MGLSGSLNHMDLFGIHPQTVARGNEYFNAIRTVRCVKSKLKHTVRFLTEKTPSDFRETQIGCGENHNRINN